MAYFNGQAVLDRIRAVVESGAGSLRVIVAGTYLGGMWDDLDAEEQSRRATVKPIVEATIDGVAWHEARPSVICTVGLLTITVTVAVTRHLGPQEKGLDNLRDVVKGLAATDADVLAQALCYPGNLDAAATGVVSGMLMFQGSTIDIELADESAGRAITTHTFTGTVQTAPS